MGGDGIMTERGLEAIEAIRVEQQRNGGTYSMCIPSDTLDDLIAEYEIIDGMAHRLEKALHETVKLLEGIEKLANAAK